MGKVLSWILKILIGSVLKDAATLKFLDGYRSYLFGAGLILTGLVGLLGGVDAGGYSIAAVTPEVAQGYIASGAGVIFAAWHKPKDRATDK